MHKALETEDANSLLVQAHNLKGISANFSAGPIMRIAAEIEALGRDEDLTRAAELVAELELEAERLRVYCAEKLGI